MAKPRFIQSIVISKSAIFLSLIILLFTITGISEADDQSIEVSDFDRLNFITKLNLQLPDLSSVKVACDKNEIAAACNYYIAYFRKKIISSTLLTDWSDIDRNPNHDVVDAERLLRGYIWDGKSTYIAPITGLNWHSTPVSGLTRFQILSVMRTAVHHTGDPKYTRYIIGHIGGYLKAFPMAGFLGKSTRDGWISYTKVAKPWYWNMIAHRLSQLSETITLIRKSSDVSNDELLAVLLRMYQEASYLRNEIHYWVDRRHNGGLLMIKAMAQTLAVLADFKEVPEWETQNIELASKYIKKAFYPDGLCVELSTAYCSAESEAVQKIAYAYTAKKDFEIFREKISQMVNSQVGLSDPTGQLPSFGDLHALKMEDYVYQPAVTMLGLTLEGHTAYGEKTPDKPVTENQLIVWPTQGREQWSGYYTMRSDWSRDARYLAIDCGPWGTNHQHGDRLSFVISAYGEQFIIDPSGTKYASNKSDAFVSRQSAGFLHNTITIDGVDVFKSEGTFDETKTPLDNLWEHGTNYSLFAGNYSYNPIKPIRWERRVLFVDGCYWLIQDVLTGSQDTVEIEQNFQFNNDIVIELNGQQINARAPNGSQLVLKPFGGNLEPKVYKGDKTPHDTYWPEGVANSINHGRGWTGQGGHKLLPAPAVTYTGTLTLPATITLAVVPIESEKKRIELPIISSEKDGDNTIWKLPTSNRTFRFVSSTDKCSVINITEPVLRLVTEPLSK